MITFFWTKISPFFTIQVATAVLVVNPKQTEYKKLNTAKWNRNAEPMQEALRLS